MYCTKCGKQIDYDSPICKECVDEMAASAAPAEAVEPAVEQNVIEQSEIEQPVQTELQPGESVEVAPATYTAQPTPPPAVYPSAGGANLRMRGFGKALTSTILGFIGYFFSVFTMAMLATEDPDVAIAGGVFFVMSLPLTIIPLIFGLKSIGLFKSTPAGMPKPIATLILGIVGLFFAALSLLFLSLALIILMGVLAMV
jgi:hypothetical protein